MQLMLRFQAGDEGAFDRLVEAYQAPVFSLLRRLLGPTASLEDLAQEVFLRLYRSRERYRPAGRLSTFLYRIAYNLALNFLRDERRRRAARLEPGADGEVADPRASRPGDAEVGDRAVWAARIEAALAELPENQRLATVLQHYDGLDLEEIGSILGISAKAVKSLLHRARENLRQRLEPYRNEA